MSTITDQRGDAYRLPVHLCSTCGLPTTGVAKGTYGERGLGAMHETCQRDPLGRLFVQAPNRGQGCLTTVTEWLMLLARNDNDPPGKAGRVSEPLGSGHDGFQGRARGTVAVPSAGTTLRSGR